MGVSRRGIVALFVRLGIGRRGHTGSLVKKFRARKNCFAWCRHEGWVGFEFEDGREGALYYEFVSGL